MATQKSDRVLKVPLLAELLFRDLDLFTIREYWQRESSEFHYVFRINHHKSDSYDAFFSFVKVHRWR
jgi:hypothetical protein